MENGNGSGTLEAVETPQETEARVAAERREDGIDDPGPAEGVAVGEGGEQEGEDAEGEGDGEEGLPPLQLEGLGSGQLSLRIGGPRPDAATAKITGAKVSLPEGEFQPGDVIEASVRLVCTKVSFTDKRNHSTGHVSERERAHDFHLQAIERTS